MLVRQHPFRRLLRYQKAAEGTNGDCLGHFRRHQIDERTTGAGGGVINHHVGAADLALDQAEQPLDLIGVGGIAGKGVSAGLAAQRTELSDLARGERDANALAGKQPRQRCAQAFAGADDKGGRVFRRLHRRVPRWGESPYLCGRCAGATRRLREPVERLIEG